MIKNLKKKLGRESKNTGFTLIELIIVIAILAILAFIMIPRQKNVKEKALEQGVLKNKQEVNAVLLSNPLTESYDGSQIKNFLSGFEDIVSMHNPYDKNKVGIEKISEGNAVPPTKEIIIIENLGKTKESINTDNLSKGTIGIAVGNNGYLVSGMLAGTSTPIADITGSGTVGDPYIVYTITGIEKIKDNLNSVYKLGCNIDLTATSQGSYNGGQGFIPIGNATTKFTGTFDGNGYSISGLYINRPTEDYVGFFGYMDGATVSQLGLENVNITGKTYVGSLAGKADNSTVTEVYATGTITVAP